VRTVNKPSPAARSQPIFRPDGVVAAHKRFGNFHGGTLGPLARRKMPMFWVVVTIFEISVALAFGFMVGRFYQIRCDELAGRDGGFTAPPVARIPRP
jgi:hypothetical protein